MVAMCCLLLTMVSAQDNGEEAAKLQGIVNGTLPNGQAFKAASTTITNGNTLGQLTANPSVRAWPPYGRTGWCQP
jgi:hypothetical protein